MSNTIYFVEDVSYKQALKILKSAPLIGNHKFDRVICYREGHRVFYIHKDIYRPQSKKSLETLKDIYGSEREYVKFSPNKTLIAFLD